MGTSANNIELFNESAALIFCELYKSVPVPTTLNYSNLSASILKDDDSVSREQKLEVFINTVTWLKNSGFIWLDAEGEQDVFGALLSPKGLEVLSIIPDSSKDARTIGAQLMDSEEQSTKDKREELINIILKAGSKV